MWIIHRGAAAPSRGGHRPDTGPTSPGHRRHAGRAGSGTAQDADILCPVTHTPVAPLREGRPGADTAGSPAAPSTGQTIRAYVALTKPRIIELLLVTTVPAMVLAARGLPDWWTVVVTLVGGTLAAGSANALNCYLDRDIDAVMHRTGHRPLARHQVSDRGALIFGSILGVVSVLIVGLGANWLAGLLTVVAIAFYVLGYTLLLKRRTSQNIVWGGAAGCMPVLIGWAAVTGDLTWAPVVLFLIVFFWTPPHFWALAIKYKDDYALAGVPMLPVVATPVQVARQIVAYSVVTAATSVALWPVATGPVYGGLSIVAGLWLIAESLILLRATVRADESSPAKPMRLFHFSNSYLAFVFVAVAVDTFLR
jgi:protoheme IX farnesyltransferase